MRTRALLPVCFLLAGSAAPAASVPRRQTAAARTSHEASRMKIRIQLEERSLTATLENTEAARDFLSLLPLTLTLPARTRIREHRPAELSAEMTAEV
jgi:hypothetical protein